MHEAAATSRTGAFPGEGARLRDYFALLKPRVMSLVVFTGFVGMVLAPGALHPVLAFTALLAIAAGAGAAGAINMAYEADLDAVMARTRRRPIPAGRIAANDALTLGVVTGGGAVITMGLAINVVAGFLLALTIGFYVFVYTMWLKRRTPQNIVIGGAAGALPPVIGWAAVTGDVGLLPLLLFAIIFIWTPPHFWALALARADEYARAGVPMLPVVAGQRRTRRDILIYSLVLAPLGVVPWLLGLTGPVYGVSALVLGGVFTAAGVDVWRRGPAEEKSQTFESTRRLFGVSILYLFLIFAAFLVDYGVGA
jgi:protoheme IX farnesyltransferase